MADVKIVESDRQGNTKDTVDGSVSDLKTLVDAGWVITAVVPSDTTPMLIILTK